MSNIPRAREELLLVARRLRDIGHEPEAADIMGILAYLYREPQVRHGPHNKSRVTPARRAAIVSYAEANPSAHLSDIAEQFNVNQGRVSEILTGKR